MMKIMSEKALHARRRYLREYHRKWRQKPENREKHKQYQKRWYQRNKEKVKINSINFYTRLAKEEEQ
jgi:hypothetical protein